jgi:hypothetical protein
MSNPTSLVLATMFFADISRLPHGDRVEWM